MTDANTILIDGNSLQFNNFSELNNEVTFCFLPAGIVIMNGKAPERPYRFQVKLDENGKVYEESIIKKIKARGVADKMEFFFINGSYIETAPHAITDEELATY